MPTGRRVRKKCCHGCRRGMKRQTDEKSRCWTRCAGRLATAASPRPNGWERRPGWAGDGERRHGHPAVCGEEMEEVYVRQGSLALQERLATRHSPYHQWMTQQLPSPRASWASMTFEPTGGAMSRGGKSRPGSPQRRRREPKETPRCVRTPFAPFKAASTEASLKTAE